MSWIQAVPGTADHLRNMLKGKRGASDDLPEINCTANRVQIEEDGTVDVWATHGAEAAKLLKRAGWALVAYKWPADTLDDWSGCVWLRFRADAFRGLHMAFKLDPERVRQEWKR